jgi:hypothetical protein
MVCSNDKGAQMPPLVQREERREEQAEMFCDDGSFDTY